MPVRSLNSSVLKWPDAAAVDRAVREWAVRLSRERSEIIRIGYFGSYARSDWGVGSDVDLLAIVAKSDRPFDLRASEWDATTLPVPADLLVYTVAEWESLPSNGRFRQTVELEIVWVKR